MRNNQKSSSFMENSTEFTIITKQIGKEYPGRVALSDVSFKVKKGSIHGFLGPNGAGKTTTMKILNGLVVPTTGQFEISGSIGFLPENPPLYGNMTVDEYLSFVFSIYEKNTSLRSNEIQKRIDSVKEKCGLMNVSNRLIENLSKGYKQRVGIAQALVHSPEIIILDEPTVGLDPVAIVEIRNLIQSLKGSHTILFSSHQLHEVELLCQEITLIDQGKILISGTIDEIQKTLTTKKQFKVKVKNLTNELILKIKKEFHIDSIEKAPSMDSEVNHSIVEWDFFANSLFDDEKDTSRLCRFLAENPLELFSFNEQKLDLEEIFKRMTLKMESK
jgi:ABC-2 type transport system ATP-binding protein